MVSHGNFHDFQETFSFLELHPFNSLVVSKTKEKRCFMDYKNKGMGNIYYTTSMYFPLKHIVAHWLSCDQNFASEFNSLRPSDAYMYW